MVTLPIFLKNGHLKMVNIGSRIFSVVTLGSNSNMSWKLISENWTPFNLTHTALGQSYHGEGLSSTGFPRLIFC